MKKVKKFKFIIGILIIGFFLVGGWLVFISYPKTHIPTTMEIRVERIVYPDIFKGILLEMNIANDKFTLLDSKIVDGYPNYLPDNYSFVARIFSFDGELLGEYGFGDPRIILAERGYTGPTWLDNINFTQIFPYFNNSKTVNIYSANQMLLSVDISEVE